MRRLTAFALLAVSACSSTAAAVPAATDLEPITLSVSLYVVQNQSAGGVSSARSVSDVELIGDRMAEIWAQAGIVLDLRVSPVAVPDDVIRAVDRRDGATFLAALRDGRFDVPDPGVLAGFYVPSAGGANGFAPSLSRVFFITDEPTVHDERVSSHEIGHLLGLHHDLDDANRLMFSGTNGMTLSADEIATARYAAQGLLDGVR